MLEFTEDKHKVNDTWPPSHRQVKLTKKDALGVFVDNSHSSVSRATAPFLLYPRDDDAAGRANENLGLRPGGQPGCPAHLPGAGGGCHPQVVHRQIQGRGLGD